MILSTYNCIRYTYILHHNVIGKLMINNSKRRFRAKTLNLNISWQLPIYDVLSQIWIKPHPPRGAQPRLSSPTMVEGAPPTQSKVTGYKRQQILSLPDRHGICHKWHLCTVFYNILQYFTIFYHSQILSLPDRHGICHKWHLCTIFLGLSKIFMN